MQLNNKLSSITDYTRKSIRNAAISVALISTLQSCDNVTGAGYKENIHDTTNIIPANIDVDIDSFEAKLPYVQQWNQPIPAISEQDSSRIENQFAVNTLRSIKQDEKPSMDIVKHIVLHSTEYSEELSIKGLKAKGNMHFIIRRNGELIQYLPSQSDRLVQANHIGKGDDETSNAMWNHDPFITFKSIGIEVCALPAQKRSDAQYETLYKLLGYLGKKYNLIQKDIITHTMVAYSKKYGLMRKQDPFGIQWDRLGLAPGSAQINKDIVSGEIAPNLTSMYERLRKAKVGEKPGGGMDHQSAIEYLHNHYSGVNDAIILHKQRYGGLNDLRAVGANTTSAWWTIAEIDDNMIYYTPPKIAKKKHAYKARHRIR